MEEAKEIYGKENITQRRGFKMQNSGISDSDPIFECEKIEKTHVCRICKEKKHDREFYRNARTTTGAFFECKICYGKQCKARYRLKNPKKEKIVYEFMTCKICKIKKTLDEFYNNRNTKEKKSHDCKDCHRKELREYYQMRKKSGV